MKMDFIIMHQLLKQSPSLLKSGYLAFVLCMVCLAFASKWLFLVALLTSVGLLLAHHYLYIRIQLDSGLLQYMLEQHGEPEHLTDQLDQSLINLQLMAADKTGRDWSARFQGCLKLLKIQMTIVLIQYVVFIVLFYTLSTR